MASRYLVKEQHVDKIVMAYHGVGFSDMMQTHMLRHEAHEVAHVVSPDKHIPFTFAEPIGASDSYIKAVVDKVRTELEDVPRHDPVAIHLSGHGLPTTRCGEYDCGSDAYHAFARDSSTGPSRPSKRPSVAPVSVPSTSTATATAVTAIPKTWCAPRWRHWKSGWLPGSNT